MTVLRDQHFHDAQAAMTAFKAQPPVAHIGDVQLRAGVTGSMQVENVVVVLVVTARYAALCLV